jgi:hypothetical protein
MKQQRKMYRVLFKENFDIEDPGLGALKSAKAKTAIRLFSRTLSAGPDWQGKDAVVKNVFTPLASILGLYSWVKSAAELERKYMLYEEVHDNPHVEQDALSMTVPDLFVRSAKRLALYRYRRQSLIIPNDEQKRRDWHTPVELPIKQIISASRSW